MLGKIKRKAVSAAKNAYVKLNTKHSAFNVEELFVSQNRYPDFQRYDIVVRYLFIEQYFGKNSIGYSLYEKMQKARAGEGYDARCIENFESLIKSYSENGYNDKSEITLGENLQLLDGSHRIAAGLYFGCPKIAVKLTPIKTEYDYSTEWFIANNFSDEEIDAIKAKYSELESICNKPFQCIMWPPMEPHFDGATKDLKKITNVLSYKDYSFTDEQCKFFIKGVYAVDDIEAWKIGKKIENMLLPGKDVFKVRVLEIKMSHPAFRVKALNCKTLSRRGEQLKSVIRTKYKPRVNYYYDNVMHIADNYAQNKHIARLKDFKLDITSFFEAVSENQYALAKLEVPYMPQDFPKNVPLGKDIDVICPKSALKDLTEAACSFCKEAVGDIPCVVREISPERTQVRLELNGFTLFIFDFTALEPGLNRQFVNDAANDVNIQNGIRVMKPEYEVIYRRNLLKSKSKDYHEKWVQNNIAHFDMAKENTYIS